MCICFNNPAKDANAQQKHIRETTSIAFLLNDLALFPVCLSALQINGIALDNKSVTECEALLRSCRDSLSLSLMKVSQNSSHFLSFFFQ